MCGYRTYASGGAEKHANKSCYQFYGGAPGRTYALRGAPGRTGEEIANNSCYQFYVLRPGEIVARMFSGIGACSAGAKPTSGPPTGALEPSEPTRLGGTLAPGHCTRRHLGDAHAHVRTVQSTLVRQDPK